MATVILINPMGADVTGLLPNLLRGTAVGPNDTVYTLPYVNQAGATNIENGKELLDDILHEIVGVKKVLAYSEGAQVATRWLRDYGTTEPIPSDELSFLFIGNAERKYGGVIYKRSEFDSIADTDGLPGTVPYDVVDLARQYDGFADYPTSQAFSDAADAVGESLTDLSRFGDAFQEVWGLFTTDATKNAANNTLQGFTWVHGFYFDVAVDDAANVVTVEGNVSYVLAPTYPLPLLGMFATPALDRTLRTQIETQYDRPAATPEPDYDDPPPFPGGPPDHSAPSTEATAPTIVATFTNAAGDPAVGYVMFEARGLREAFTTPNGIVAPAKVFVPLDGYGSMVCTLEPGDYNVQIVLQDSRTVFTVMTVPVGAATLDLRDLLAAYMPTPIQSEVAFLEPGPVEFAIPFSATKIDYVLLGGGGAGADGTLTAGAGGLCGSWVYGTLVRGDDIPTATQVLSGRVGRGGTGSPVNPLGGQNNGDGQATTLWGAGLSELSAAGGEWAANTGTIFGVVVPISYGQGVPEIALNDREYAGGAVQMTWGANGNGPGGGGSGGFSFLPGGDGASGGLWLKAY